MKIEAVANPRINAPKSHLARIDGVLAALLTLAAALLYFDAQQFPVVVQFVGSAVANTFPFLVLAVALAAAAKAASVDHLIVRAFSSSPQRAIVMAALMGALSPFCSCGVIPLITAMLSIGIPLGPVMAFWLASPLMDPSMFVITASTLGIDFAVAKTIAAIGVGLLGGAVAQSLTTSGWVGETLKAGVGNGGCGGAQIRAPKTVVWAFWREPARLAAFVSTARSTTYFLSKWLVLAFVLESLMLTYIPVHQITALLGGDGLWPIVVATLVGVPAYLNGYAALPLVKGLMQQGLQPGSAMAFLVAGGVTSLPAIMAVVAVARPRVVMIYLGMAAAGAFLSGVLYGALH